jgi:hypothetical protein
VSEWLEAAVGKRFPRNRVSDCLNNLSCRTCPSAAAVRPRSRVCSRSSTTFCNCSIWVCQWKELPIGKDGEGRPEIHYTRIYSTWRRWEADGCIDAIFEGSVWKLHQDELLDLTVMA